MLFSCPTESPNRSPKRPFAERERSRKVPSQRLPQPAPRPRLLVQDTSSRPEGVKAVQVG